MSTLYYFYEALQQLLTGEASAIRRDSWEHGIVVFLQKPDDHSMNTEPYLAMRTFKGGEKTKCVPWEPGHASIFADDWDCEHNFSNASNG